MTKIYCEFNLYSVIHFIGLNFYVFFTFFIAINPVVWLSLFQHYLVTISESSLYWLTRTYIGQKWTISIPKQYTHTHLYFHYSTIQNIKVLTYTTVKFYVRSYSFLWGQLQTLWLCCWQSCSNLVTIVQIV